MNMGPSSRQTKEKQAPGPRPLDCSVAVQCRDCDAHEGKIVVASMKHHAAWPLAFVLAQGLTIAVAAGKSHMPLVLKRFL
jgi:hypothetical protein